jgi:hypothetical protein
MNVDAAYVEEMGSDNVGWIHVVLVRLWAHVNTVMNIPVP